MYKGFLVKEPEGAILDVVYRPLWQTHKTSVDLFYARPFLRDDVGTEILGAAPLVRQQTVEATMARQINYLQKAFQALHICFERGERFRMLVRINSLALATSEAAAQVTETFRTLSREERAHIIPEILEFPKSLSLNTLDDITIPLMAFFDTWIAHPEKQQSDFTPFANLNYSGVSLDLFDKPMDLKLASKVIQLFTQRASHRRLPTTIHGLATPQLAKLARIANADVLSGAYMDMDSLSPGPVLEGPEPFMI